MVDLGGDLVAAPHHWHADLCPMCADAVLRAAWMPPAKWLTPGVSKDGPV